MATRSIPFSEEELRLISQWANNAEHDADQSRMLTRPDSPQEKAATADQEFIQHLQAKLSERVSRAALAEWLAT